MLNPSTQSATRIFHPEPYRLIPAVLLAVSLFGCHQSIAYQEVSRTPSPDGQFDAIVYEINGGATTSFGYEVDLAPHRSQYGVKAALLYGALRNSNAYGVNVHWEKADSLSIECFKTREPTRLWSPITVADRTFDVVVHTGKADMKAPPGGMFYNLKHSGTATVPTASNEGTYSR